MRTPAQEASAYLLKAWRRETGMQSAFPPIELQTAVTLTVQATGYTRKIVDNLVQKYRKANP